MWAAVHQGAPMDWDAGMSHTCSFFFPSFKVKCHLEATTFFFLSIYLVTWAQISGKGFGSVKCSLAAVTLCWHLLPTSEPLLTATTSSACVMGHSSIAVNSPWWRRCPCTGVCWSLIAEQSCPKSSKPRGKLLKGPKCCWGLLAGGIPKEGRRDGFLFVENLFLLAPFRPFSKVGWNSIKCPGFGWA